MQHPYEPEMFSELPGVPLHITHPPRSLLLAALTELSSTRGTLHTTEAKLEDAEAKLEDAEAKLEAFEAELKDYKEGAAKLEETAAKLEETAAELKETVSAVARLQNERDDAQEDLEYSYQARRNLEKKLEEAEKEIAQIDELLAEAQMMQASAAREL
jgi:chromosome segregation ATPase